MNIEQLRDYCLSKSGVEESFPFDADTLVFKVRGKIFCLTNLSNDVFSFSVKCNPEYAIELREQYLAVQPGYHLNKKHWNTILVDGTLFDSMLHRFVDDSYDLVSKK